MAHILVVDDDSDLLKLVEVPLFNRGHEVKTCVDSVEALDLLGHGSYDFLITDLQMPEVDGIELLRQAKQITPQTDGIIITAHGSIDTAIQAVREGAIDYLRKPFSVQELVLIIDRACANKKLTQENQELKQALREKYHSKNILGASPAMQQVFRMIEKVAPSNSTVLITGESGTGKELVAQALHISSPRAEKPLVKVNCTALTETLLESELFGHEKGSFTGATATRQGLFRAAEGGTIFLDEVGDTSPSLQAKLLRVLQEGEFRRVGSNQTEKIDVRVLAATNRDLKTLIAEKTFREDLYYRLNVVTIPLPPLRDRKDDVLILAKHFIQQFSPDPAQPIKIDPEVVEALSRYSWPGNVRELENVLERAVLLCESGRVTLGDLSEELQNCLDLPAPSRTDVGLAFDDVPVDQLPSLQDIEREHIIRVLKAVHGHKTQAAEILGITRRTLYANINRFGLEDMKF